jgi:hypothetical protein
MKLTKTLAAVMAAAFALPVVATAGEAVKGGASQTDSTIILAQAAEDKFNMLDVNQDGVIDRNEAAADPELAASFDQVDLTGTGEITIEEFSAWEEVSESTGTPANGATRTAGARSATAGFACPSPGMLAICTSHSLPWRPSSRAS